MEEKKVFWVVARVVRDDSEDIGFALVENPSAIDYDPLARVKELEKEIAAWLSDAYYQRSRLEVFTSRYDALATQVLDLREELLKRDAQIEEMGDLIDRQSNEIDEMRPVYETVGALSARELRDTGNEIVTRILRAFIEGAR